MDQPTIQFAITFIIGGLITLIFTYWPAAQTWFNSQVNKGPLMLLFVVIVSAAYFGLGCTSLASSLNIIVACSSGGAVALGKVVLAMAMGNGLTYLFTQPGTPKLPAPPTTK